MAIAVFILALAAIFPAAGVRRLAQVVLGLVTVASAVVATALVVGAVMLERQGGFALIFFALVPALVAWISGALFMSSVRVSRSRRLPVAEQMAEARASLDATEAQLTARLEDMHRARRRFWIGPRRRRELDAAIARDERLLGMLPALRPAIESPASYEQERA